MQKPRGGLFVADKRRVKNNLKRLESLKTWQLLVLLIIAATISATRLRINNNGMVERRLAVLQADKADDASALRNNLYSLQRYSSEHMNAGSGVIYLEEGYKRDTKKIFETIERSINSGALQEADARCQQQYGRYSQAYIFCVRSEQAKLPAGNGSNQLSAPNPELYRHEFSSPLWSPDFAGWSVLIVLFITGVIVARLIGIVILRLLLRKHYSSI